MEDNTNITLETDRLILRDFREDDWQAVNEWAADPAVLKYEPSGPETELETKDHIKKILARQKEQPRVSYQFAIINKPEEKLIGHIGITKKSIESKEAEIGYILNHKYWNQGYMTEAACGVVKFGFSQLGLHRITASCDPGNTGSYRVMEKAGMQREGCLREHEFWKGDWRDSLLYAILEQEWRNR